MPHIKILTKIKEFSFKKNKKNEKKDEYRIID